MRKLRQSLVMIIAFSITASVLLAWLTLGERLARATLQFSENHPLLLRGGTLLLLLLTVFTLIVVSTRRRA